MMMMTMDPKTFLMLCFAFVVVVELEWFAAVVDVELVERSMGALEQSPMSHPLTFEFVHAPLDSSCAQASNRMVLLSFFILEDFFVSSENIYNKVFTWMVHWSVVQYIGEKVVLCCWNI